MSSETLHQLRKLLDPSEVLERSNDEFKEQSAPWSVTYEENPTLVVRPKSIASMQKAVKLLCDSDLDFAVRGTGTGSASAGDVVLSTHGFKEFGFDHESKTATVGSGFSWGELDRLMEDEAPGFQLVGARCTWVGVAGSILAGGYSWLSHEYGLSSDPGNFLDAQVVLADGRVVWASEEPDLLWALRGGGGNFGVVTQLKLQGRPCTNKIFSGIFEIPYSSLLETSKVILTMGDWPADPKLAFHVTNAGPGMGRPPPGSKPDILILAYDANGEEHARSDNGFGLLLKVSGAKEVVGAEMSLRQINALADSFRNWQGNNMFWLSAPMVSELDEEFLVREWKWFEDAVDKVYDGLDAGSLVLLEFMQPAAFHSAGSRSATAWPHKERRHVLQLGLGCKQEGAPADIRERCMKHFERAAGMISKPGEHIGEYHAAFMFEWNDLREVYGENWPRLQAIKRKYDARDRFHKKGVSFLTAEACS